jgi:hypothetical protein
MLRMTAKFYGLYTRSAVFRFVILRFAQYYRKHLWSSVFGIRHTEHREVSSDFLVNSNQYINISDNHSAELVALTLLCL